MVEEFHEEVGPSFIDKYTFQFESIIKVILHKELSQANVLPVERSNKKFISFLKEYIIPVVYYLCYYPILLN